VRARLYRALFIVVILLTVIAQIGYSPISKAAPAPIGIRSIKISDNRANSTAEYMLSLNALGSGNIGSLKLEFCSNSALPNTPCVAPNGFNVRTATLSAQSGITDFTQLPGTSDNVIGLTRVPGAVATVPVSYTFAGVINPSFNGNFFLRVYTYSSIDATGTPLTDGGLALAIASGVNVNVTVPPYLTFCTGTTIPIFDCASANGDYVDFGELSSTRISSGTAQMMTTTNAAGGYSIRVIGTTLTSGNNIINANDTADVARTGTAQFGLNLRNNSAPFVGAEPDGLGVGTPTPGYNNPDHYKFTSGDVVATAPQPDLFKRYTISYIVDVPKAQPPGVYVTTLTYICLANF
jgi:hypothetical protein